MSELLRLNASLHNHTLASDGRDSSTDLVYTAYKNNVHFLAASDHWTVASQYAMLAAADKLNQECGNKVIEVMVAEEIGCRYWENRKLKSADVHVCFPDRRLGLDHIRNHRRYTTQPLLHSTIRNFLESGVIVTLLHPNEALVHGITLHTLESVVGNTPANLLSRLCVEVSNWQTRFLPRRHAKEQQIATRLNCCPVYFSDAHVAEYTGRVITEVQVADCSGKAFEEAIINRRTRIIDFSSSMFKNFVELLH